MHGVGSTAVRELDPMRSKPTNWVQGMSMRLALDLGLHLDMTPYVQRGDLSAFEADVRRVAFWGSYATDQ